MSMTTQSIQKQIDTIEAFINEKAERDVLDSYLCGVAKMFGGRFAQIKLKLVTKVPACYERNLNRLRRQLKQLTNAKSFDCPVCYIEK